MSRLLQAVPSGRQPYSAIPLEKPPASFAVSSVRVRGRHRSTGPSMKQRTNVDPLDDTEKATLRTVPRNRRVIALPAKIIGMLIAKASGDICERNVPDLGAALRRALSAFTAFRRRRFINRWFDNKNRTMGQTNDALGDRTEQPLIEPRAAV